MGTAFIEGVYRQHSSGREVGSRGRAIYRHAVVRKMRGNEGREEGGEYNRKMNERGKVESGKGKEK